jgi:Spy/CpxP family protein refolding chaperone
MRRYLPWILLAVSVALNAFFIGGHVYHRQFAGRHGPPPAEALNERIVQRLQLTPAQRDAVLKLRQETRERYRQGRAMDKEIGMALLDELSKAQRDSAVVDKLTRQLNDRRLGYVRPTIEQVGDYLASLSPEQRQRVREVAEERGPMFLIAPDRPERRRAPE